METMFYNISLIAGQILCNAHGSIFALTFERPALRIGLVFATPSLTEIACNRYQW